MMNADAIVKALKCCNVPSGRACSECPYHEVGEECRTQRNKDAVEFILKLTEENEKLKGEIHIRDEIIDYRGAEILRHDECIRTLHKEIENLKADLKYAEEEYERVYEQAEADIRGNMADGGTSCHWCIAGHRADAVRKMQEKILAKSEYGTINISPWQLDQIAKEILED
jgi:hypothetical protein